MNQIHREAQSQLHPSVVIVIGRTPGALTNLVVVGRDSFLDELVETAGGKNLMSAESNSAYPRVSLETFLRLNPDSIYSCVIAERIIMCAWYRWYAIPIHGRLR